MPKDGIGGAGALGSPDAPSYEERVMDQMHSETNRLGVGKLDDLLKAGDTWIVSDSQTVS